MMSTARMMMLAVVAFSTSLQIAKAEVPKDSTSLAISLGDILASEEPCNLTYDQNAIMAFIEKNVREDDMDFSVLLKGMTEASSLQIRGMSKSELALHCFQNARVAHSYKFIK